MWVAGGGIKGGQSVGETDDFGHEAQGTLGVDKFEVKHLHATILHQMGLDPNHLTVVLGHPGQSRRLRENLARPRLRIDIGVRREADDDRPFRFTIAVAGQRDRNRYDRQKRSQRPPETDTYSSCRH